MTARPCQGSSVGVISAVIGWISAEGSSPRAHSTDGRGGGPDGYIRRSAGWRHRRWSNGATKQLHRKARWLAKRRQPIREDWLRRYHEVVDFAGTEFADHGGSDSSGARLRYGEGTGRQGGPSRRQNCR